MLVLLIQQHTRTILDTRNNFVAKAESNLDNTRTSESVTANIQAHDRSHAPARPRGRVQIRQQGKERGAAEPISTIAEQHEEDARSRGKVLATAKNIIVETSECGLCCCNGPKHAVLFVLLASCCQLCCFVWSFSVHFACLCPCMSLSFVLLHIIVCVFLLHL